MKREKRKYLNAGSYSSGTMIAADVHEGLIENPDEDPASQEPYVIISDNDNIEYYEWDGEGYVSIWGFA